MGGAGTRSGLGNNPPIPHLHRHIPEACKSPAVPDWWVVPIAHLLSRLDASVSPGERRRRMGGKRDLSLPAARQPASLGVRRIAALGYSFAMCLSLVAPCTG